MKLFTTQQIRELDAYTIAHEPISSLDLMERASGAMTDWILRNVANGADKGVVVVCGNGNNGGDGLVIARRLKMCGLRVDVLMVDKDGRMSSDCEVNLKRYEEKFSKVLGAVDFNDYDIIVDAMFGSGLNRPLGGLYADMADRINASGKLVVAVDIPSGLYGDDNSNNPFEHIVKAHHTLTLQFPKLAFMMPESEPYTGEVHILPIGISVDGIVQTATPYYFTEKSDLPALPRRGKFSHKGTYGHALMVGGSEGKAGAVFLASKACLRSGAGLLSVYAPMAVESVLQVSLPEAMCIPCNDEKTLATAPDADKYDAVGVGCGMGTDEAAAKALAELLDKTEKPMVVDADALNIISNHKNLIEKIPSGSVLTPHPKEWERICGVSLKNRMAQIDAARKFCLKYKQNLILKGAYSAVVTSDGGVHFNTTGNPGMATAGSGDVLCGVVLGLLSQGMRGDEAAVLAAYLHGLAGDKAAETHGEVSLMAGDIAECLCQAFFDFSNFGC